MTIATFFTYLRVLLIPVFMLLFYADFAYSNYVAALVFIFASLTDWLDGYLARKLDQCTRFGAFLDPVADKLLVTVTLVLLAATYSSPWFAVPAAIMVAREVLVSALREWMAGNRASGSVAVAYIGKVKTTVQMIAIVVLLASSPQGPAWQWMTGFFLIYVAAVLTIWSMMVYIRSAWPVLKADLKQDSGGRGADRPKGK